MRLMHWLNTLRKLCVTQKKKPALKFASSRHHASRPVKLSLKVSMKGHVFDLTNVDQFLIAHATCACTHMHLLNATQGIAKNTDRWQICFRA